MKQCPDNMKEILEDNRIQVYLYSDDNYEMDNIINIINNSWDIKYDINGIINIIQDNKFSKDVYLLISEEYINKTNDFLKEKGYDCIILRFSQKYENTQEKIEDSVNRD